MMASWFTKSVALISGFSTGMQRVSEAADARRYPPPGELVDVGGRRLHVMDKGGPGPTVVVETGSGALALGWEELARALAGEARVVLYDRAGYGWSDGPGWRPRTADDVAEDLSRALDAVSATPPYVLVGHSLGGLYVRAFAARHPDSVSGVVLVDSSHDEMLQRLRAELGGAVIAQVVLSSLALAAAPRGLLRLAVMLPAGRKAAKGMVGGETSEELDLLVALYLRSAMRQASLAEMMGMPATMRRLHGARLSVPLAVVTAAEPGPDDRSLLATLRPTWLELQNDLATLADETRHVIASTGGHFVHNDDPEVVLDAIRWVVSRASVGRGA